MLRPPECVGLKLRTLSLIGGVGSETEQYDNPMHNTRERCRHADGGETGPKAHGRSVIMRWVLTSNVIRLRPLKKAELASM
jgi:hypothetical protein